MKRVTIARLESNALAVFGQLIDADDKKLICCTLERPWVHNEPDVSCIPAGVYLAHRFRGKRPYDVFKLAGVPGRSDVELHIGNVPANSEGCILLGQSFGVLGGQRGVVNSHAAFSDFMTWAFGEDTIEITIVDPPAAEAV